MQMVSVRKSTVPLDLIKFPDCDKDTGWGVFQDIGGRVTIYVQGDNIESIRSTDMDPLHHKYKMLSGFDEDFVIVPTVESIRSGNVPVPFRVQHDSKNPTHKLDWVDEGRDYPHSYYVLRPKRYIHPNTELTFDYNF